jgi:hypothetical protein
MNMHRRVVAALLFLSAAALLCHSQNATPTPAQSSLAGNWIAFAAALIAALIAAGVAVLGHRRQRELQARNEALERELRERAEQFDREKIDLQRQTNLKQKEEEAGLQRKLEKAAAAEDEAERFRTAEELAAAYRRKVIEALRNLKILDMTRPLNLEALYVQVRVREDEPPRYGQDEEVLKLAAGEPVERPRPCRPRRRSAGTG